MWYVFIFYRNVIIFVESKKLSFLGILCTNNPSCWYFTWIDTSYDGNLGPEWHNRCYLKDGKIEGFVERNGMISGTKWCPGTKSPVHIQFETKAMDYRP